jgi:sugar (pentulose or hexulose) kinase
LTEEGVPTRLGLNQWNRTTVGEILTVIPPRNVAGIGLGGQRAGIVGIDEKGEASTTYDSWLDIRCEPNQVISEVFHTDITGERLKMCERLAREQSAGLLPVFASS